MRALNWIPALAILVGCVDTGPLPEEATHGGMCDHAADDLAGFGVVHGELSVSCAAKTATGYSSGKATAIKVVTVDGKPVEIHTANAYAVMAGAAAKNGVKMALVSGFRTMAEQQYLYNCYKNCNCNNCNLAAKPGYSNHQSGHALDLNTSSAGVFAWLKKHGAAYGFKKTVPSEDWHWEWWGGGPGGGPCPACGSCDDKNVCTDDGCSGNTCSHKANAKACQDGAACTVGDVCAGGKCKAGAAKNCNDKNLCTDDGCNAGTCSHKANAKVCDDGDGCTAADACAGSKCKGGKIKDCNDGNPCTADACAGGACSHAAAAGSCDDGNACTSGDGCAGGACAGQVMDCSDGLPCTADSCQGGQCQHAGAVQLPVKVCVGADVGVALPCGGSKLAETCPIDAPCSAGTCTPVIVADAGPTDTDDTATTDTVSTDTVTTDTVATDAADGALDTGQAETAPGDDILRVDGMAADGRDGRADGEPAQRDASASDVRLQSGDASQDAGAAASTPDAQMANGCAAGSPRGQPLALLALVFAIAAVLRRRSTRRQA